MSDWAAGKPSIPDLSAELLIDSVERDDFRLAVNNEASVFALIDACDEPQVPAKAALAGRSRAISLYRAKAERNYASFAPYLFAVDHALLSWIEDDLYGKPWGYFFVTDGNSEIESLRRHWRRFLQVTVSDGEKVYFRFYDPRIVEPFLKACNAHERRDFLGPARCLILEHAKQLRSITDYFGSRLGEPCDGLAVPAENVTQLTYTYGDNLGGTAFAMQPRHTQAFVHDKRQRIEHEICELLRSDYADDLKRHGIEDGQLPQMVHTAIDRAKVYGVVGRQDVELYLICMLRLGLDFDTNIRLGWPHETLGRSDLTGTDKMDVFYARLFDQRAAETT